jgi:hypothetical protein
MGWITGSRSSKFPKYTFSKSRRQIRKYGGNWLWIKQKLCLTVSPCASVAATHAGSAAQAGGAWYFSPLILPPFATNCVEKPGRLFARKHHADIAGRNPRRPGGVKFLTLGKRCALVKGAIRSAHAGAEQRRCFDYEDAVQSTVPIVVGEQPKGHAGFIARDDGSRYCDDGHAQKS